MKLSFTILLVAGVIAQAFFSLNIPSVNKWVDIKSIVACGACGKPDH